ncbi:MAG: GH-E family nuclease [Burkholderiales bacterium]
MDPNTNRPIDGKPDLGHKTGNEHRTEAASAKSEGLTQKQFNDRMNNPDKYQLEDPSSIEVIDLRRSPDRICS